MDRLVARTHLAVVRGHWGLFTGHKKRGKITRWAFKNPHSFVVVVVDVVVVVVLVVVVTPSQLSSYVSRSRIHSHESRAITSYWFRITDIWKHLLKYLGALDLFGTGACVFRVSTKTINLTLVIVKLVLTVSCNLAPLRRGNFSTWLARVIKPDCRVLGDSRLESSL